MSKRDDDWRRVSAMAGLDEEGAILPPPPGLKIDRTPSPWWRNRFAPPNVSTPSVSPKPENTQ